MPIPIIKRNGIYHFNLRIPQAYVDHYPGTHITGSLKTRDKREAERRAAERVLEIYDEWERIHTTGSKAKTILMEKHLLAHFPCSSIMDSFL